jgi:hypothetical protein
MGEYIEEAMVVVLLQQEATFHKSPFSHLLLLVLLFIHFWG